MTLLFSVDRIEYSITKTNGGVQWDTEATLQ